MRRVVGCRSAQRETMKKLASIALLASVVALAACQNVSRTSKDTTPASSSAATIRVAINDRSRIVSHKERDKYRHPEDVLIFGQIKSGSRILEIAPMSGYYTALLSRIVGPSGKLYSVDPKRLIDAHEQFAKMFPDFASQDARSNVDYSVQMLDAFSIIEPVDQAIVSLFYHDTVWVEIDRAKMVARIFDALIPPRNIVSDRSPCGARRRYCRSQTLT